MKNRQRILMMTDLLMGRKKILFLSMLMILSAFLLFDMVSSLMAELTYEYDEYIKLYQKDTEDVYKVQFQYMEEDNSILGGRETYLSFLEELKAIDGVEHAGGYTYNRFRFDELSISDEYIQIMGERKVAEYDLPIGAGDSQVLLMDSTCMDMLSLNLKQEVREEFLQTHEDYWPVLAGSAFEGILKEGDILHWGEQTCKVAGFLEEGARWPIVGGHGLYFYRTQKLDYQFVLKLEDIRNTQGCPTFNALYFTLENGADRIAVREKVQNLGNEYEAILSVSSVEEILSEAVSDQTIAENMYEKLLYFMLLLCILTATASSLISVMVQRRKIGIWYANGILPSDVQKMIVMEQFVKILISAVLAYGIGMWYANQSSEVYKMVHQTITLKKMGIVAVISYVITVLVPCIYISRQHIVKLLQIRD